MQITISPELERFLVSQVELGRYESVSELLLQAVECLKQGQEAGSRKREALCARLQEGISDLDDLHVLCGTSDELQARFKHRGRERLRQWEREAIAT